MVKQFKGQTKIADVQAAFDDIVTKINNLVTSYNAQSYVEEIDYTIGGTTLAPSGYTLTVGGYKQFLKACEGVVTGCKPIKVDDNHFKVTTGMLVGSLGIFRLPDSVLAIPTDTQYRTLYYNTVSKTYEWVRQGHSILVEKTGHIGSVLEKIEGSDAYQYPSSIGSNFNQCDIWYSGGYPHTVVYKEYIDSTKIKLDIGKFKVLSNGMLEAGDTIKLLNPDYNMYTGGNERNQISGLIFGYLDSDGETFTPRFTFRNRRRGNGNGVDLWTTIEYNISFSKRNESIATIDYDKYILNGFWSPSEWYGFSIAFSKNGSQEVITVNQLSKDGSIINTTSANIPDAMNIETNYVNCVLIGNAQYEGNIYPTQYQWIKSSGTISNLNTDGQDYTYYDVVIEPAESISYRVCDINPNCTSDYIGTLHNAQCEDINGTYGIYSDTVDYTDHWQKSRDNKGTQDGLWYQARDTSKDQFIMGLCSDAYREKKSGGGSSTTYIWGETFMHLHEPSSYGDYELYGPATYLFLPKGVANPYTYVTSLGGSTDIRDSSQKALDVIVERDIEDTSG